MTSEHFEISFKILLKQVYAAHTSKVRALQEEIEDLKNKLQEADRQIKQSDTKCKRCIQLEEAFNSCKTALIEQSRRFENLGQRFSVFNTSPSKSSKSDKNVSINETGIETEISMHPEPLNQVSQKSSINPQNLLKNYTSCNSAENLDSLDLCSLPFPKQIAHDFSTFNSDSLVLAPDTVDIIEDGNTIKNKKLGKNSFPTITVKVASDKISKHINKSTDKESIEPEQRVKKRILSEPSECEKSCKRLSIEENVAGSNGVKSISMQKAEKKELTSEPVSDQEVIQDLNQFATNDQLVKDTSKEKPISKSQDLKNFISAVLNKSEKSDYIEKVNTKVLPVDDIVLLEAESKGDTLKEKRNSADKETLNIIIKDGDYQVSPSLLPVNKILKSSLSNQNFATDDSDFQSPVLNKRQTVRDGGSKQAEDEGAWTACDKKKLKKRQPLRIFKSTSKFTMQLDALPPNFKKPTYKQTKLSKSIFQPKVSSNQESEHKCKVPEDAINTENEEDSASNPIPSTSRTNAVDFDATCIPENYEIISSGNKENQSKKNLSDSIEYIDTKSFSDSSNDSSPKSNILREKEDNSDSNNSPVFEDFILKPTTANTSEHMSSFDRLPKREEPKYKYKEDTVRKKSERKQLNGFDCKECEKYYSDLGLTDKEKQERLKKCSRHRSKFAPPPTPEHFWELEFPDTQECKARGYLNETQKVKLKTHRRRPLE